MTKIDLPPAPMPVTIAPARGQGVFAALKLAQARFPLLQVALLILVFAFGAISIKGFVGVNSIKSMLVLAALVGLTAVGQTLVVLIGGLDLSVAGFIVAGALAATQLSTLYQWSFPTAILVIIVGGGVLGGLSGYISHRLEINPLIVTLAMGAIVVGLIQVQTGGGQSGSAPTWLSQLSSVRTSVFGLPVPPVILIWVIVGVLMWILLSKTRAGRTIYFTGTNPRAAELALVSTRTVWVGVFAFSAIASALAGVLLAGFAGAVDGNLGQPYLFQSLAAVIVGGVAFGGPGDYWRTMIGALLLTVLTVVLIGLGFTNADRQVIYGIIILLAMAAYGREKKISSRI